MLLFEPNVVVIDDQIEEVIGIIDYYKNQGIGCKYFNPHLITGDTPPEKCFSDVSLIFLDIYFTSNFYDYNPEFCSEWISSIIPEKTFYILIIWTTDKDKGNEVLQELNKNNRTPFCYFIKGKEQYKTSVGYNFKGLQKDIEEELGKTPALSEIGLWKKNIKLASNRVIGGLTKNSNPEDFKKKLRKIIVSQSGTSVYYCKDTSRKRGILFEALDKILISNSGIRNLDEGYMDNGGLYDIVKEQPPIFDRELNSWFHFKLSNKFTQDLITPGLLCRFQESQWKKTYSVEKDERILKVISRQSHTDVKIESIALLINRPCDIAQNKYGNNLQLLSGLKISNPKRKENSKKDFQNGDPLPDSCKLYDHLYFSDKEPDVVLLFDFRYVFSVPEKVFVEKFDNIKIFNNELLSEILVMHGSYSSKLGIIQYI